MRFMLRAPAAVAFSVLLAACSGGGGTATVGPGNTSVGGTAAAAVCAPNSGAATVTANAKGFAFDPATITAKVGDVISWKNGDSAPHGIALDSGDTKCTDSIAGGASGGTSFTQAGTFPFHCFVHPNMKGTITIT